MSVFTQAVPNWMERWGVRKRPAAESRLSSTASAGLGQLLVGAWRGLLSLQAARSSTRRLRLVEKISLGDKHFVALLEIDGVAFLASSGGSGSLTLTAAHELQGNKQGLAAFQASGRLSAESSEGVSTPWPTGGDSDGGQALPGAPEAQPVFAAVTGAAAASAQGAPSRPGVRKSTTAEKKQSSAKAAPESATGNARLSAPEPETKLARLIAASSALPAKKTEARSRAHAAPAKAAKVAPVEAAPSLSKQQAVVSAGDKPAKAARASAPKKAAVSTARTRTPKAAPQPLTQTASHSTNYAAEWTVFSAPPLTAPVLPTRSEDAEEQQGITAANRFAALLELRMLASEVFAEIDSKNQVAPAEAEPPSSERATLARERRTASPISTGLHRLRRRLGGLACVGFAFLAFHGTAHAQTPGPVHATPMVAAAMPTVAPSLHFANAVSSLAFVQPATSGDIRISGLGGSSASWSIVVLLTILTLIPALLMCVTPFARMLIVFHFLRQALGLQTTPSNQTLIGLSLILTFFLMQPVGEVIYRDAIIPAQAGKLTPLDAVVRAGDPLKHFMARFVREKDAELFLEIAKEPRPRTVDDLSFRVMLPAYILSELKAGFQIGTVLFLPFLIVDMVVASITTSVGMMQLPPVVISTPLKLLLFLMVDGWHLLIGALMRSFN